jgi:hypothetical protein
VKIEAMCSSETPVDFQRTARRYIPEDRTLHLPNVICSYFLGECNFDLSPTPKYRTLPYFFKEFVIYYNFVFHSRDETWDT